MLLGNLNEFAVEIYHEPAGPQWTGFGRMCLHIQGLTIGNIEEQHCSLFHAVERICEVAKVMASQWDERFAGHTDEEIFAWLDAGLYSGKVSVEDEDVHRFDFVTNTGEQFDDSKTFIYCSPEGMVRVLFERRDRVFRSACCDVATCCRVSTDLARWFKEPTRS
jgi:hypothetical protein